VIELLASEGIDLMLGALHSYHARIRLVLSEVKGNRMPFNVAIIVGSLRKGSFNRKLANAFIKVAPATLKGEIVEIGEISFFSEDLEANPPASWVAFRNKIKPADAVLFVTPEYNRSVPGVLKNAIDVGSRPYGQSVFDGKPAGVISGSVAATGGFGANHHLRQTLAYLNMPTMGQPEAYLGNLGQCVDDKGELIEKTKQFVAKFAEAFAAWVATHKK
jgi:chromate reductase